MVQALPRYRKEKPQLQPGWVRPFRDVFGDSSNVPFSGYAEDPVGFIQGKLGIQLTPEQRQLAESVRDKAETNVPAGHGLGKTKVAACVALWWVFAVGGRFISTAPTNRQVTELLWGEIRSMYDAHKEQLGGERGVSYIRLTEAARGVGYAAADRNLDSFQGAHAENLLIIEDEANGISFEIDEGASSCLTGSSNRMLRIGNPTASGTAFEDSCKESSIRLPVWSHPNVNWAYDLHEDGIHRLKRDVAAQILGEDRRVIPQSEWPKELPRDTIPGAVSIEWIENVRRKKGEKSSYWLSRVEALFPQDVGQSIVPQSWFLAARARYDANPAHWDALANRGYNKMGLDVGDGRDPHALARWKGPVLYSVKEMPTVGDRQDTSRAANFGWAELCEHPGVIAVDQIGVGAGALSEMLGIIRERPNELGGASTVQGCNFGAKPEDDSDDAFLTTHLKHDLYLSLREAFRKEEIAIAPLGEIEEKLMRGFSLIYYEETRSGYTVIEPKTKTRKRLKRSTDPEDAVVMGWGAKRKQNRSVL